MNLPPLLYKLPREEEKGEEGHFAEERISKQKWTSNTLSPSSIHIASWNMYDHPPTPYPPSDGLNSSTIIFLQRWLWHWIIHKGWYTLKQRNQTKYLYMWVVYIYIDLYMHTNMFVSDGRSGIEMVGIYIYKYIHIYLHKTKLQHSGVIKYQWTVSWSLSN